MGLRANFVRLLAASAILATTASEPSDGAVADGLKLDVSPKQASFRIPGNVTVTLAFVNTSSKPVFLNRAYNVAVLGDCSLRIHMLSDTGARPSEKLMLRGRRPTRYVDDDFVRIGPGDTYREELDLAHWFELTEPGTYEIRVEYRNVHPLTARGSPVWTGQAVSMTKKLTLAR